MIERPASVVKELVENSLDAQAATISVAIREGGLLEIEVADDGSGIAADQLSLAVERHATSKLSDAGDLGRIHSLGFRGEALASIAAVAEATIVSRCPEAAAASVLHVRDGKAAAGRARARAPGTTVTVRALFGATPARLKFLASPRAEAARVARIVQQFALVYPEKSFELQNSGRTVLRTDGTGDRRQVLAALHGAEMADRTLDLTVASQEGGVSVRGLVTASADSTNGRALVTLACNGRIINHRPFVYAVEQAYAGMIRTDHHPLAVILIEVPLDAIDVNVHPTKAEVRFENERAIFSAVERTVRAALMEAAGSVPTPEISGSEPFVQPVPAVRTQHFSWRPQPSSARLVEVDAAGAPDNGSTTVRHGAQAAPLGALRIVGQIRDAYIIAEGDDGLFMIDQHAAHERVLYERFVGVSTSSTSAVQPLLHPAAVQVDPETYSAIEAHGDELAKLGMQVEAFGDLTILIRAVPISGAGRDAESLLRSIMAEARREKTTRSWPDRLAASLACHSAIRAGDRLHAEQQQQLIRSLEECLDPRHCAHGRPTMLQMTAAELERSFGRS